LRELSNILQGICLSQKEIYKKPIDIIKLWLHECHRIFADRFMFMDDLTKFNDLIASVSKQYFDETPTTGLFTSFMETGKDGVEVYTITEDVEKLKNVLEKRLEEYNLDHPVMDLVLFDQA